jgi:RNA polymerase sigma-70 factor (ECF subfamily)
LGEINIDEGLRHELKAAWHRFLDLVEPERPALHRYCRKLTGNLWDAEDLVQETMLRAFGTLGKLDYAVRSPRAYLYRLATNGWIDALRRRRTAETAVLDLPERSHDPDAAGNVRDAATELMIHLAPQERAAVLLKDAIGMSLDEIAEILGTSQGAIKSALHRGRKRLRNVDPETEPGGAVPSEILLDRFVAAYNAADIEALTALVLENATVEMLGCMFQAGPEARNGDKSWFQGAIGGHPEWPAAFQFESQRAERSEFKREPIVLVFRTRSGEEALESVLRLEEESGMVRLLRVYAFCPDTIREVASELGLGVRTGRYRYPTPAPGKSYLDET